MLQVTSCTYYYIYKNKPTLEYQLNANSFIAFTFTISKEIKIVSIQTFSGTS